VFGQANIQIQIHHLKIKDLENASHNITTLNYNCI